MPVIADRLPNRSSLVLLKLPPSIWYWRRVVLYSAGQVSLQQSWRLFQTVWVLSYWEQSVGSSGTRFMTLWNLEVEYAASPRLRRRTLYRTSLNELLASLRQLKLQPACNARALETIWHEKVHIVAWLRQKPDPLQSHSLLINFCPCYYDAPTMSNITDAVPERFTYDLLILYSTREFIVNNAL